MPIPDVPKGLAKQADDALDALVAQLPALQDKYKTELLDRVDEEGEVYDRYSRNKYFQGIATPSAIPRDGRAEPVSKSLRPTDQDEDWASMGVVLPASSVISVRIDVYESDEGWGYTVTGTIDVGGVVWSRCVNFGHDESRAHDWIEVE